MTAHDRLIVALDVPNIVQGLDLAQRIGDAASFYKIGLGMLTGGGLALATDALMRGEPGQARQELSVGGAEIGSFAGKIFDRFGIVVDLAGQLLEIVEDRAAAEETQTVRGRRRANPVDFIHGGVVCDPRGIGRIGQ